jgi:hypothetical protein
MRVAKNILDKKTATTNARHQISNIILAILFFASMGLIIWGINIYRLTIINPKYLFALITFGIFPGFILIKFVLKPSYKIVWIFLNSIAIGGGTLYFLFLYLNSTYSGKEQLSGNFNIIKTGTLAKGRSGSCGSPYAVVDFNGTEKELIFFCDYENTISSFSKVRLEYSKGFFGFDIIKTKTLIK